MVKFVSAAGTKTDPEEIPAQFKRERPYPDFFLHLLDLLGESYERLIIKYTHEKNYEKRMYYIGKQSAIKDVYKHYLELNCGKKSEEGS